MSNKSARQSGKPFLFGVENETSLCGLRGADSEAREETEERRVQGGRSDSASPPLRARAPTGRERRRISLRITDHWPLLSV